MVSDEALKKLQEQIEAWPMAQRFVVQQLIEEYLSAREHVRAYEAHEAYYEEYRAKYNCMCEKVHSIEEKLKEEHERNIILEA